MTSCIENLLRRIDGVRRTGPGRWISRCPAHEDRTPSLSIKLADDGRVLVHDFGGCSVEDVLAAVGMTVADLFPDRMPDSRLSPEERRTRAEARAEHRARDLVELAAREAVICAIVAGDVIEGRGTTLADCQRARQAVETIYGIVREVRHVSSHR